MRSLIDKQKKLLCKDKERMSDSHSDDEVITKYLTNIVLSYEQFALITKLPFLLLNSLSDSTANRNVTFYEDLFSSTRAMTYSDISAMFGSIAATFQPGKYKEEDELRYVNIFSSALTEFTDEFNNDPLLDPIGGIVSSDETYPSEYDQLIKRGCVTTISIILKQIADHCTSPLQSSACTGFTRSDSRTAIASRVQEISFEIKGKVFADIAIGSNNASYASFENYANTVCTLFLSSTSNGLQLYARKVYFICMLPYIAFIYSSHFLPTKYINVNNMAPRNMVVRQTAILTIYKIISYTFFSFYKASNAIIPAHGTTNRLVNLTDNIVTRLFILESDINNDRSNASVLTADFDSLQTANREISLVRSQITNISSNMRFLKKESKALKSWLIVWAVFLCVYCAVSAAILFFMKSFIEFYVMFSMGLTFFILVLLMIKLIRA